MKKGLFLGLLSFAVFAETPPGGGSVMAAGGDIYHFNSSDMAEAVAAVDDRPLYDVVLMIDQTPRPDDNGGNVFIAGFLGVDSSGFPEAGILPSDYQQLGVWVQAWPYRREVQLVKGLHYFAQYGYSAFPSPRDRVSLSFVVDEEPSGPIEVHIQFNSPFQAPEAVMSTVQPRRSADAESRAIFSNLVVSFDPLPTDLSGSIFLTGFQDVDDSNGMPVRDSAPTDFNTIATDLVELPFDEEISLVPGLHYFAMYGHGAHPEPSDRMSLGQLFSEGDEALELTIGELTTPSDSEGGQAPVEVETLAPTQPSSSSQMGMPSMQDMRGMVEGHVKKWAGIALLGGLFIGGFIGWFLRGRVR